MKRKKKKKRIKTKLQASPPLKAFRRSYSQVFYVNAILKDFLKSQEDICDGVIC